MRVSVYFYRNIDRESALFRKLKALKDNYDTSYWIAGVGGFGADKLSWHDAATLAAKIAVTVLKSGSASVFEEMRIMLQTDSP